MGVVANGALRNGHAGLVREDDVIRVSGAVDDWYDLGIRIAAAACGDGVCAVRAINQASVYRAVLGLIHARALTAARGLDLQITIGRQKVSGTRDEPLDAVLMYAWARQPDAMPWEQAPPP